MLIPVRIYVDYREDYPVTLTLIGINFLAFIPVLLTSCEGLGSLFMTYGLVPGSPQPHQFITHMFLHGGVLHFVFNMLFLWLFGKVVESIFGHAKFLLFYFGGGIVAALVELAVCNAAGVALNVPMVGASGAIAAVLGVFLIRYYFVKIEMRWFFFFFFFFRIYTFYLRAWVFLLLLWFVPQLVFALLTLGWFSGVAYWAHTGGFLFGAFLGLQMNLFKEAQAEVSFIKGIDASWSSEEKSRIHLKESVDASPKNIRARLQLARSYVTEQKANRAVQEYVQAFEIAYRGGDVEQAMDIYETALALSDDELILPEEKELEVAVQCIKHAHYELGFRILEKLHMLRPDHPKTEEILARMVSISANKLARYEEALGYFKELRKNHPQSKYIEMLKWDMNKVKHLVRTSS